MPAVSEVIVYAVRARTMVLLLSKADANSAQSVFVSGPREQL